MGMGHKTAVSLLFAVGVTQTFFLNKRWTFAHRGYGPDSYARYWAAYGMAYVLNLANLVLFVDLLGYNHQIVQGLLVIGIAALLFLVQKFWVFREVAPGTDAEPGQIARP
jgi:putative flippase GtrA